MSKRIGIDTNILIYSQTESSIYFERAKKCMELIEEKLFAAVISAQNISEFCSSLTNSKFTGKNFTVDDITNRAMNFLESGYFELIFPTSESVRKYIDLAKKLKVRGHDHHDVFLSSTFLINGVDSIITEDSKFFKRCGLKTLDLNRLEDVAG